MTLPQDISIKILRLLEKSPVYQVDLTHSLNIKHDQRIAEAVRLLLNDHKITREKVKYKRGTTFKISLNGGHKRIDFNALLHKDRFAPCTGCHLDCHPPTCVKIIEWISE